MSDITVTNLTYLYFLINREADRGKSPDINDVQDAMASQKTMEFLQDYVEPSGNLELDSLDKDELNAMFERYYVPDPNDLSVENNGLLYLAANIVEIVQNGDWKDDQGQNLEMQNVKLDNIW